MKKITTVRYLGGVTEDVQIDLKSGNTVTISLREAKELKKILKQLLKVNNIV